MLFNLNSAFLVASFMYFMILIILINIWRNNKHEFEGLLDFVIAYSSLCLSSIIIIFRTANPGATAIVAQNIIGTGFFLFSLRGLSAIFHIDRNFLPDYLIFSATAVIFIIFSYVSPNFLVRSNFLFIVVIYFSLRILVKIYSINSEKLFFWKMSLFIFYGLIIFIFVIRIIMLIHIQPGNFNMNINTINAVLWSIMFLTYAGIGFYYISIITYLQKAKLADIIEQRNVILRESHHRIKNNLMLLTSLIRQKNITPENANIDFENLQNDLISRINSVTYIHDNLYKASDFSTINLKLYVTDLIESIIRTLLPENSGIRIIADVEDIQLQSELCLSIGLIINELLTNSIKYAFRALSEGTIKLEITSNEKHIIIHYSDNGKGFSCREGTAHSGGFGLDLIESLLNQINADLTVDSESGCDYHFVIPVL